MLKIIIFLIFILTANFSYAQTVLDFSKATDVQMKIDSINKVKYVFYTFYIDYKPAWERTMVNRIFSKDSVLLFERTEKSKSKGGCIASTVFENIIMFDEKRNYKTREMKNADTYIIKKYDSSGKLLSKEKVNRYDLKESWDGDIYTGEYEQSKKKKKKK
ncbi:MAG: hypothetical protein ABIP51_22285 [Bacteroidia bacterium]